MTEDELNQKIEDFWHSMPVETEFPEQLDLIHKVKDSELRDSLYVNLCNIIINRFVLFRYKKSENIVLAKNEEAQTLIKAISWLPETACVSYYTAVAEYFKGNYSKSLGLLEQIFAPSEDYIITEEEFCSNFLVFTCVPLSFWDKIIEIIKSNNHDKGVVELAQAVQILYCLDYDEKLYNALTKALQINPASELANELLGFYYGSVRKWANAIACFERLQYQPYTVTYSMLMFEMAWCYGELGDHKSEIESYQKCLDSAPEYENARNNLGYAYYKDRQYQKAAEVYKECIDMRVDLKYACSNYVVALAALGKFKAAHQFIKTSPCKVRKYAIDRLQAAESGKARIPAAQRAALNMESVGVPKTIRENLSQFSNEKLLEDELEARLRNGSNIFGVNLKIYKRRGIYGQQFIIPVGRLDLLAEDDNGCLYVIELKKDSGYDDAFAQTKQYVDYLEKSELADGKPVKGIICLSNPTPELVEAVRGDDRISLFEYQISYTKIM